MSFEVGNKVKVSINDTDYAGTIITYKDSVYTVNVEGMGATKPFEESDLELLVGETSLPEVTNDDNGDVLTVVDGEWAKATPSDEPDYGQQSYKTVVNTTSYTTAQDGNYIRCNNTCSLASFSHGDIAKVTFDGVEYEVVARASRFGKALGDGVADFSRYPFYITTGTFPGEAGSMLYTEQAGTYSIKIEKRITSPTQDFSEAVFGTIRYIRFMTISLVGGVEISCNYSRNELKSMFDNETPVIISIDGVFGASGMKYNNGNIEFRVLDFYKISNAPVVKERIILMAETGTPEFTYSENIYDLTVHS